MTVAGAIAEWEFKGKPGASRLRDLYEFLYVHLYAQYEPTRRTTPNSSAHFIRRIDAWLSNLDDDDDRWAAFRSLEYMFFAGHDEFSELYRVASEHVIVPWILTDNGVDIFSPAAAANLKHAMGQTWVCPVTDSLRINSFLHLTGIAGKPYRPDWHSLSELGDVRKINSFVRKKKIRRLVLIEDFSGSGTQFSRALKFAVKAFPGPILAIPLLVCHPGDKKLRSTISEGRWKRVQYSPVCVVPETCLVREKALESEPRLFEGLRKAMLSAYIRMGRPDVDGAAFGYSGVASLVTLFSNCPNNTPPMFHRVGKSWNPIFPRANRY